VSRWKLADEAAKGEIPGRIEPPTGISSRPREWFIVKLRCGDVSPSGVFVVPDDSAIGKTFSDKPMPEPDAPIDSPPPSPAWAGALGVIAIVLGVFLTATHANEWMKQSVVGGFAPPSKILPAAICPEDELADEGLSLVECEQMVARLEGVIQATPDWFVAVQTALATLGTLIAFGSIVVGAALVNFRTWAPLAAVVTFGALLSIDIGGALAALNAGPIVREMYLWNALLWILLHLMMTIGAVIGQRGGAEAHRFVRSA